MARPLIPGEVETAPCGTLLNEDREAGTAMVAGSCDRPVHVGSRFHPFEANAALLLGRAAARGKPHPPWGRPRGTRPRRPGREAAVGLLLALVLLPLPALAQGMGCSGAIAQADLNDCAAREFEAADRALNGAYAEAVAGARRAGARQEDLLRQAQRAWIAFRDAACAADASLFDGGSAQPMVESGCLARLTEARAADLRAYAEIAP